MIIKIKRIFQLRKKGVYMDLKDVYNNEEAIKEYVVDLKTLHEVIDMRSWI